jgi:antirestriction protein
MSCLLSVSSILANALKATPSADTMYCFYNAVPKYSTPMQYQIYIQKNIQSHVMITMPGLRDVSILCKECASSPWRQHHTYVVVVVVVM